MYLSSGENYFLVSLPNMKVKCKSGIMITGPNIKVRLLSYSEASKCISMTNSGMNQLLINDEIVEKVVLGVIGFDGEVIDFEASDAGLCDALAERIMMESVYILNNIDLAYERIAPSVTWVETICCIVSNRMSTPYTDVLNLPIDEVIKRYAICQASFPDLLPLEKAEEKVSKVGG